MSESIKKIPVQPIINAHKSGIIETFRRFGLLLGRKVGLIKTSDFALEKQYIDLGRQADHLVDGLRNKNLSCDMEQVREIRFGDEVSLAYAKNFVKILDNTHRMGLMKSQNHESANKIYDLSIKQSKIAQQLNKRGINPAHLEDSEAGYEAEEGYTRPDLPLNTNGTVSLDDLRQLLGINQLPSLEGIEIPSLDDVFVSEDIQGFVDGLFSGYEGVTKEEAQNHFKIAGMFIRDKRERQPLAVAKALINAYEVEDKHEVIQLLNILSQHFPEVALSAFCQIFKMEQDHELRSLLESSIHDLVQAILVSSQKRKDTFSLFSDDIAAFSSQDYGHKIAKLKRGSKEWRDQVQEFSDLLKYHHISRIQNMDFLDLLPLESRAEGHIVEMGSDASDICDFITLAVMQQKIPKKMTNVYHFFLDVMSHLKKQAVGTRMGDAQGVNVITAALARTSMSRLVDRGAIQPQEETMQILHSEVARQSSFNRRREATAQAAENGLSLYVTNERGDLNTIMESKTLNDKIFLLAKRKVPGYMSIKEDLKDFHEVEPNLRLQRPRDTTEDDLYNLSYQIARPGAL